MNYAEILLKLGYRLKDCGNYFQTSAVFRGGNNTTALQIYKDSGVCIDYVEGKKFPFVVLVQKTLGTRDPKAVARFYKQEALPKQKRKNLLSQEKTYSEKSLSKLLPHYDFYLDRGIKQGVLREFKCGLATSGRMYQRIVFPVYNRAGQIHGFAGRAVNERTPKWYLVGKSAEWIYPFYSVEKSKEDVLEKGELFLVESIGDALSLCNAGFYNVMVAFGLNVSSKLCAIICSLPLQKIFIAFNNDFQNNINRGNEGAFKMFLRLSQHVDCDRLFFAPPPKNDFGEMKEGEIIEYVEECKKAEHKECFQDLIAVGIDSNINGAKKLLKTYKFLYD